MIGLKLNKKDFVSISFIFTIEMWKILIASCTWYKKLVSYHFIFEQYILILSYNTSIIVWIFTINKNIIF